MASQKGYNYSILVGVDLDTKDTNRQLTNWAKDKNIKIGVGIDGEEGIRSLTSATNEATESAENLSLSYQVANQIFHKSIEAISSMIDQVYELNAAQVEFRKVSDLSGAALDGYTNKLSAIGAEVGRTA